MPTGNYRTGARRDRRIHDPGRPPIGTPVLGVPFLDESDPSQAIWVLNVQLFDAATGLPFPDDHFQLTGRQIKSRVIDSAGASHTATVVISTDNTVELTAMGPFALGAGQFLIMPWDNGFRGKYGEWAGPLRVTANIVP